MTDEEIIEKYKQKFGLFWDAHIKEMLIEARQVLPLEVKSYYLLLPNIKTGRIGVTLDRVEQRDENNPKWAIRQGEGLCLNKNEEWEYEPMPSSREEDFLERCRWDTAEEAFKFYQGLQ